MAGEWREARFDELCDVSRGASPQPIHEWIAQVGIPWVKISDASSAGSRFIEKTSECIRHEGRSRSVSVYPGDLILSNSATPGIPMFLAIEACIHDGWLLLRNFRGLDKLFAYYLLLHELAALVEKGNGSVFTNLKTEILKKHKVRVPPLAEQHAIAHILGTLDDKIELNRRMSETLEAMARALFKAWFVDFEQVLAKCRGESATRPYKPLHSGQFAAWLD
jgi:type I restriction enzyme S subunit